MFLICLEYNYVLYYRRTVSGFLIINLLMALFIFEKKVKRSYNICHCNTSLLDKFTIIGQCNAILSIKINIYKPKNEKTEAFLLKPDITVMEDNKVRSIIY